MRRIWVVLITLVVTAGLVGGGGWWYMNNKTEKEKKGLQTQIDKLNQELSGLKQTSTGSASSGSTAGSGSTSGNIYTDSAAKFSFTIPEGWEVKSSEYYVTAAGSKATVPTVILGRKSDTSEENTNKININPRQSSCEQLSPTPDRSEPAGSQSVKVYVGSTDTFCVSAEVSGKDNSGKSTPYEFISYYSDTSVKEAFKTIVGSFKVL